MAVSESRKKANRKWDASNRDRYWCCYVRFPTGERERIAARAEALGLPLAEYIRNLVYADLDRAQDA